MYFLILFYISSATQELKRLFLTCSSISACNDPPTCLSSPLFSSGPDIHRPSILHGIVHNTPLMLMLQCTMIMTKKIEVGYHTLHISVTTSQPGLRNPTMTAGAGHRTSHLSLHSCALGSRPQSLAFRDTEVAFLESPQPCLHRFHRFL